MQKTSGRCIRFSGVSIETLSGIYLLARYDFHNTFSHQWSSLWNIQRTYLDITETFFLVQVDMIVAMQNVIKVHLVNHLTHVFSKLSTMFQITFITSKIIRACQTWGDSLSVGLMKTKINNRGSGLPR